MAKVITALVVVLLSTAGSAFSSEPLTSPQSDAKCAVLPPSKHPFVFSRGEILEYKIDVQGAQMGTLKFEVLPVEQDNLPLRVEGKTNTFANKIRRVSFRGTSYVVPQTLHPVRYVEDTTENMIHRRSNVEFRDKDHVAVVHSDRSDGPGKPKHYEFEYNRNKLDMVGTFYFLRQMPLQQGGSICFDVFGLCHLARVVGGVVGREHLSLPIGEFGAWHLQAQVVRLDNHSMRLQVHAWISDDEHRFPLVIIATINDVTARVTLTSITRPGYERQRADGPENIKW